MSRHINHDTGMAFSKPHSRNLRTGRRSESNHYYFLTTAVAGRRKIFTRQERAHIVLDAIRWMDNANRFGVDAAVVMPDHLHLVGRLRERTLAEVMHTIKSYSAHRLSAAGVKSPVWQAGFHDHNLRDDEDYRVKVRYVLQNPLRAGLAGRVEDYPYLILPDWWVMPD
ncbi:MAG: transposase [Proteobacteria bacterium]|nr:transposase [Pseudomonadota bacterium]